VQQVSSGKVDENDNLPAVQFIPPLMQLYPDVEVEHADDTSSLVQRSKGGKWTWVFSGRTVYLVAPALDGGASEQDCMHGLRILHHTDVAPLLQLYLLETGQLLSS
jgi:hypothetical protein